MLYWLEPLYLPHIAITETSVNTHTFGLWPGGSGSTGRKPTQAQGKHTSSTKKPGTFFLCRGLIREVKWVSVWADIQGSTKTGLCQLSQKYSSTGTAQFYIIFVQHCLKHIGVGKGKWQLNTYSVCPCPVNQVQLIGSAYSSKCISLSCMVGWGCGAVLSQHSS